LYAVVYLKPKQLIIKDCARRFVLKLYRHEASRGLFATAELLVNEEMVGGRERVTTDEERVLRDN